MLRITGGTLRGRMIATPANQRTRPTQARLRQALFNSIQSHTPEAKVLDLFAGSGSLGFEALSRGASEIVFVEDSKIAAQLIRKNSADLKVDSQIHIVQEKVELALKRFRRLAPFDLILADPPYSEGWEMKLLQTLPWGELLRDGGLFCLEWGTQKSQVEELPEKVSHLVKVREKNYGDSALTTYEKAGPESGIGVGVGVG